MATFVLIPGAGGIAWYWHRVVPLLEQAGHAAIAVELPGDDPDAGLADYAARATAAIGDRRDAILVAQSLGGFAAPLVRDVAAIVLVNAMIPSPGERLGDWGAHTGSSEARKAAAERGGYAVEFDEATYFFHDVPRELVEEGARHEREQNEAIFEERCKFAAWPDVPIHVIAGRDDRLFPIEFQRRIARERLHVDVHELPGGHLIALSNPRGLVEQLLTYV
jgi:pimeloyl-ACP methyl ester carboxylesterase